MTGNIQRMRGLQLRAIDTLVMTDVPVPAIGPNEVLVKTKATTICTSDIHDIAKNPFGIKFPRIIGHEAAGEVVSCGTEVAHLSPGMKVAEHPVVPCGQCSECKRGFEHICTNMGHLGYDRDGTFADYFVQRADRLVQLPEKMPLSLGALLEPVAVCLQAIARAGNIAGRTVFISGDGPFGNIIARLAKRAGAVRIVVSGRSDFRLSKIPDIEIATKNFRREADVAILAVSAADAVHDCLESLRPRGRLVVFSSLEGPVSLDLFRLHLSELEIVGACNDEDKLLESLNCLSDDALAIKDLITHEIPFENWEEAIDLARNGHDKALKVAMTFK